MDKKQLEKNILDLKYQFQMQKIQSALTISGIGLLAFIGTFIWYNERLAFGIGLSVIIIILSLIQYSEAKNKLKNIVKDIRKLANY